MATFHVNVDQFGQFDVHIRQFADAHGWVECDDFPASLYTEDQLFDMRDSLTMDKPTRAAAGMELALRAIADWTCVPRCSLPIHRYQLETTDV